MVFVEMDQIFSFVIAGCQVLPSNKISRPIMMDDHRIIRFRFHRPADVVLTRIADVHAVPCWSVTADTDGSVSVVVEACHKRP